MPCPSRGVQWARHTSYLATLTPTLARSINKIHNSEKLGRPTQYVYLFNRSNVPATVLTKYRVQVVWEREGGWGAVITVPAHHMAYFLVHSRANSLYFSRSVLYILAISGTSGSSGFGSQSSEQMDSNTFEIVSAGDH